MSKNKEKDHGGRPTIYDPDFARIAELVISESGFSIAKLARLFKVKSRSTIYDWIRDHKEFSDSLERGRDTFTNTKVKRALAKRATGYRYTETTYEMVEDPDNPEKLKLTITKKVSKSKAPDVSAIKHWQLNRDPENWKDSKNVDLTSKGKTFGINWIIEGEEKKEAEK